MLEKTRQIFRDKLNPLLFASTGQQINRTDIKSLFEHSSSIHLLIKALLGELLNGFLEIIECEVYDHYMKRKFKQLMVINTINIK